MRALHDTAKTKATWLRKTASRARAGNKTVSLLPADVERLADLLDTLLLHAPISNETAYGMNACLACRAPVIELDADGLCPVCAATPGREP